MQINLDSKSFREVQRKVALLQKDSAKKAINTALAKAAKVGQVAAKREITSLYNVKAGEVSDRLSVGIDRRESIATIKARYSKQRYPRIPLIKFGARDTKRKGVAYRIKKGASKQRMRHAFVATMPSGHKGVYQRVQGSRKIKEVVTIDIATMFNTRNVKRAVLDRVSESMPRYISHEINRALLRVGFK